jgi:hypothetical protein
MWVRRPSTSQQTIDSERFRQNTEFLNENNDGKKLELVNTIFMETYLENIREGMNHRDAVQKAKWIAFCFLMQKK